MRKLVLLDVHEALNTEFKKLKSVVVNMYRELVTSRGMFAYYQCINYIVS